MSNLKVVKFPDGTVAHTHVSQEVNIPDITEWTCPVQELFLLITKDWRNWHESRKENEVSWRLNKTIFTHIPTKISIEKFRENYYSENMIYESSLSISQLEVAGVVLLASIWKEVYYGYKLNRIDRIKKIRLDKKNKQARLQEAQHIREYLEGVGK